jgi:quercetin dioxygenase-like cupin family protein
MDSPFANYMYKDKRGIINDIVVGKNWSVTYISFKKGAVRGNHYHKKTTQTDYIISGRLLYNNRPVKRGDIITIAPGEIHAYTALEDSEMMSICSGVRVGDNYAKDTYKVECK